MRLNYILKTSMTALWANKTRSTLTILGIVIGVAAIILVTGLGQGAQNLILDQIHGLGGQTIIIEPGRQPQGPSDFSEAFTDSLREKEYQAITKKSNIPGIKQATPLVVLSATAIYNNETKRSQIVGASETLFNIFDIELADGNVITNEDIKQMAFTTVIGDKVREKLFGQSDALGQKIKIKNRTFKVVGIVNPMGNVASLDIDNLIVVPYTTAQHYLSGTNYYNMIMVQAESEDIVPQVNEDIKRTLREMHNITDSAKDDFHLVTQADAIQMVSMITNILNVLLGSIAAISLVVGGVGIMNIMLVSVTERTREIGLRKALGASNANILTQFLLEAILLTSIGGLFGVAFGAGGSFLTSIILSKTVAAGWSFTFPVQSAILGLTVSALIGLIFGLYPARQAAQKSPIEALRYE
ncbi:MAG: hypothetical protein AUJ33_03040 [Parcubacteria group bacterium CG1_02_40_25]|nr:MAG: hypothetical protein AUJ33_03040 [Parcubacteria group bacterium CG1_02_40_25]